MKKSFVFAVVLAIFFMACGSGSKKGSITAPNEEPGSSGVSGNIVSLERLRELREGAEMVVRTVYSGEKTEDFRVRFVSVVDDIFPPLSLIFLEASDSAFVKLGGIAAGMSGSPVIWNGKIVGALSYGLEFQSRPPFYFLATPIESMLNWDPGFDTKKFRAQKSVAWKGRTVIPLTVPIIGTGVSSRLYESLREKIRSKGISLMFDKLDGLATAGTAKSDKISYPIVPGSPLGVSLVLGDEVNIAGVGTATYIDGSDILGFGHPMLDDGEVGFPIVGARILAEISNIESPYKFFTIGNTIMGTINLDITPGIRGTLAEVPRLADMILNIKYPDGRLVSLRHQMPKKGLFIGDQAYFLTIASFSPVVSRFDNIPGRSLRVGRKIWFDEIADENASIDYTSIASGIDLGILDLVDMSARDLFFSSFMGAYQDFRELTISKVEVGVEVVDSLLVSRVINVSADTAGYIGDVVRAHVGLRVGIGGKESVDFIFSLPDTMPAGYYNLDIGPFVELKFAGSDPSYGALGSSLEEHFQLVNDLGRNTVLAALLSFSSPDYPEAETTSGSDSSAVPPLPQVTPYGEINNEGPEASLVKFEILESRDIGLAVTGRSKTISVHIKKKG